MEGFHWLKSMGEIHPYIMKRTADISGRNLIGPKLRKLRLAKKPEVTLEDLAGKLAARGVHLDRSAIGRIENQNRYVLDYELKALADALRISTTDLF
jgi:transcriptional regulator with XRE-family HTH domain